MIERHEQACALVLDRLEAALTQVVPTGPLAGPTRDLLAGVRTTFAATPPHNVVSVQVPLAFVSPDRQLDEATDLIGVAAACTALYVGARLLDDLMDGHDVSYFADEQSSLDVLRWATFLSIVPPLLLSKLDCDPAVRVRAVEDLSSGMALMASGQLGDAKAQVAVLSPDDALQAIRGKTGALLGTFARCAARVSGGSDQVVDFADRFGMALGVGRQLVNDQQKLDRSPATEPAPAYLVASHAASLTEPERVAFVDLVVASATDESARATVASLLLESAAPANAAMLAEMEFAQAISAISLMAPDPVVAARLETMVDAASMIPPGG